LFVGALGFALQQQVFTGSQLDGLACKVSARNGEIATAQHVGRTQRNQRDLAASHERGTQGRFLAALETVTEETLQLARQIMS
jgi:hypothetical protein